MTIPADSPIEPVATGIGHRCRSIVVASIVCFLLFASDVCADGLGGSNVETAPIPDKLQGIHPIHEPELDGVEQLLVLSDQWVIVVSNKMHELYAEIDRASDGKLQAMVDRWERSHASGRSDWGAYRGRWRIRDEHIAQARESIGERRHGRTAFFTIVSPGDPRYAKPLHPSRADYLYVSAGQSRTTSGVFDIDYNIYSYIEFPEPMRDGEYYEISLVDGGSVQFLFDRKATVSRAIKVNQLGYLPDAGTKRAYLGVYLYRFGPLDLSYADRFEVIDVATGEVALTGKLELLEANPRFAPKQKSDDPTMRPLMYGEDVYVADFSKLKKEGVFFVSVPGVGRSWPFSHSHAVYGEAFYTTMRGLFHQRAGMPIEETYSHWTRPLHKRGPYCESEHISFPMHTGGPKDYKRFDVIGGSIGCGSTRDEIPGGWHDAAGWDSNDRHYTVIFDLLNAFAMRPKAFTDRQLDLPESGNGVPDILDEARFGLEIWRYSMNERGGVSGMLETWTHPRMRNHDADYAFSQRTRWSSLMFAAAAAQYAQLVAPFDRQDASLYKAAALQAYEFGNSESYSLGNIIIHAKTKRGKGSPYTIEWTETDEHVKPYLLHARLRLYLLTRDEAFLEGVWDLARNGHKPFQWHFTRRDFSPWIYFSVIEASDALPGSLGKEWRRWFIKDANLLLDHLGDSPYAITFPRKQDHWLAWGASDITNMNRTLFIANFLTGDQRYLDAAALNIDFMLGANPMGMSWTTGIGFVYPIDIQHEMSEMDGIVDPVPGITIYSINGAPIYHRFRIQVWQSPNRAEVTEFVSHDSQREPPMWRRWMVHPRYNVGQNEFTIHETMASTILTAAMLIPNDWRPENQGLKVKPRSPKSLHGSWYLP